VGDDKKDFSTTLRGWHEGGIAPLGTMTKRRVEGQKNLVGRHLTEKKRPADFADRGK